LLDSTAKGTYYTHLLCTAKVRQAYQFFAVDSEVHEYDAKVTQRSVCKFARGAVRQALYSEAREANRFTGYVITARHVELCAVAWRTFAVMVGKLLTTPAKMIEDM